MKYNNRLYAILITLFCCSTGLAMDISLSVQKPTPDLTANDVINFFDATYIFQNKRTIPLCKVVQSAFKEITSLENIIKKSVSTRTLLERSTLTDNELNKYKDTVLDQLFEQKPTDIPVVFSFLLTRAQDNTIAYNDAEVVFTMLQEKKINIDIKTIDVPINAYRILYNFDPITYQEYAPELIQQKTTILLTSAASLEQHKQLFKQHSQKKLNELRKQQEQKKVTAQCLTEQQTNINIDQILEKFDEEIKDQIKTLVDPVGQFLVKTEKTIATHKKQEQLRAKTQRSFKKDKKRREKKLQQLRAKRETIINDLNNRNSLNNTPKTQSFYQKHPVVAVSFCFAMGALLAIITRHLQQSPHTYMEHLQKILTLYDLLKENVINRLA